MLLRTTALALTALAGAPNAYAQRALEELVLPRAEFSEPDEEPPAQRPVLNVLQSGAIVYRGEVFYDPDKHKGAELEARAAQLLLSIRSAGLANQTLSLTEQAGGAGKLKLLDDPILIRADKWAPWRTVRAIMKQCSRPEIAFWKIQLGAAELDRETGQHNPRLGAPAPKAGDPGDDVRFAGGGFVASPSSAAGRLATAGAGGGAAALSALYCACSARTSGVRSSGPGARPLASTKPRSHALSCVRSVSMLTAGCARDERAERAAVKLI